MADPKKSYNDIITWAKGTSNDIIAKKLATPRSISITNNAGTSLASGNFDGSANVTLKLPATVGIDISGNAATATTATTATKLGTANKGSATQPIYLNAGVPTAVGSSLAVSVTGNAATATKLTTPRTIELTGDVTGSGTFDGSANLSIVTALLSSSSSQVSHTKTTGSYYTIDEITFPSKLMIKLIHPTRVNTMFPTSQSGTTDVITFNEPFSVTSTNVISWIIGSYSRSASSVQVVTGTKNPYLTGGSTGGSGYNLYSDITTTTLTINNNTPIYLGIIVGYKP